MNKVKAGSNMYQFISHTWNPILGACPHACVYCYAKVNKYYQGEMRFSNKAINEYLTWDNFIFVGSMFDIFAEKVPEEWIITILKKCLMGFPSNQYLFQTKNPARFSIFDYIPILQKKPNYVLGTTIETNRDDEYWSKKISTAPTIRERIKSMADLDSARKMVSIEPIMDFDLEEVVMIIKWVNPEFVSIGADSKGHNLPEPPAEKVRDLIAELSKFTKVIEKDNIKRILK